VRFPPRWRQSTLALGWPVSCHKGNHRAKHRSSKPIVSFPVVHYNTKWCIARNHTGKTRCPKMAM